MSLTVSHTITNTEHTVGSSVNPCVFVEGVSHKELSGVGIYFQEEEEGEEEMEKGWETQCKATQLTICL